MMMRVEVAMVKKVRVRDELNARWVMLLCSMLLLLYGGNDKMRKSSWRKSRTDDSFVVLLFCTGKPFFSNGVMMMKNRAGKKAF